MLQCDGPSSVPPIFFGQGLVSSSVRVLDSGVSGRQLAGFEARPANPPQVKPRDMRDALEAHLLDSVISVEDSDSDSSLVYHRGRGGE